MFEEQDPKKTDVRTQAESEATITSKDPREQDEVLQSRRSGYNEKDNTNYNLFNNIWNKEALKILYKSFKSRLIPLNKVWPRIPTV